MNPICTFDFKFLRYSKSWFSRTMPCLLATRFQSKTLHSYRKFRLKSVLLILASDNWCCKDFKSSYWNPWFSINIFMFLRKYSSNLFHQSVSQIQYLCGNWSDQKHLFLVLKSDSPEVPKSATDLVSSGGWKCRFTVSISFMCSTKFSTENIILSRDVCVLKNLSERFLQWNPKSVKKLRTFTMIAYFEVQTHLSPNYRLIFNLNFQSENYMWKENWLKVQFFPKIQSVLWEF